MGARTFRSQESHDYEGVTRTMLPAFLRSRGFRVLEDLRERNGQTIKARDRVGNEVTARVKLCWRRRTKGRDEANRSDRSGAQLLARISGTDWTGSIQRKLDNERHRGTTHLLVVQRDDESFASAALIPLNEVLPVWIKQRDISAALIREGKLGNRRKNHAMNGDSPTLWLQDDDGGQEVAAALWAHPGVRDLVRDAGFSHEDFSLPEEIANPAHFEEGALQTVTISAYERDPRARSACIAAHGTICAACDTNLETVYGAEVSGLIHVHHLTPIAARKARYKLNPVADLVPVCPNCHAVIHHRGVCRSIGEVREMLVRAGAKLRSQG